MRQLHTFFRALLFQALAAALLPCATVTGQVQISSTAASSHSLSDLVVWLEPANPASAPPHSEHARLLQKDKTFRPHVLVVRTGTIIDFPNDDPIFHNAFSTYDGQLFDVGLYPPGTNRQVRFRRPGVVRVFCNIHPAMSAVIVVVDTPYFKKVSAQGEYRFSDVQAGTYLVNLYDERATHSQTNKIPIQVATGEQEVTVPVIAVSEAGYARTKHKNKFGLDYPPGSDDPGYDGVMK